MHHLLAIEQASHRRRVLTDLAGRDRPQPERIASRVARSGRHEDASRRQTVDGCDPRGRRRCIPQPGNGEERPEPESGCRLSR